MATRRQRGALEAIPRAGARLSARAQPCGARRERSHAGVLRRVAGLERLAAGGPGAGKISHVPAGNALLAFCDRAIRVKIPSSSVYRGAWRGLIAEPKTLGEHLRRKRVDMGLTNIQVAEILGVAYQTVERWEHNRRPITPRNRAKIVAFLGYVQTPRSLSPADDSHAGNLGVNVLCKTGRRADKSSPFSWRNVSAPRSLVGRRQARILPRPVTFPVIHARITAWLGE